VTGRTLSLTRAIAIAIALSLAPAASAAAHVQPRASLLGIESQVMCTSCGEPLNEVVSSPQAISEKQYIQGLIDKGYTQPQILHSLVKQYGVGVLARPPASGFNLLIYILPPAVLAAGVAFLLLTLPRWRARGGAERSSEGAAPLPPEDAKRLDDDLARLI
jgi:cytochrome c-type biogenesis protein CcmH